MAVATLTSNTIKFQENVPFETYQKICDFLNNLGVRIETESRVEPHGLTEEDLKNIEISRQQIARGEGIPSEKVHKQMWDKYGK